MTPPLEFRALTPAEYPVWDALVGDSDEGSSYQRSDYLSALATATQAAWHIWGVFSDDQLLGGLGTYETASWLGRRASSRLLLYYNGPVVRSAASEQPTKRERHRRHVLATLESGLRRQSFRSIRFKARQPESDYRPFLERGWTAKPIYTYVANLENVQTLWQRMDNNLRRLVRRCEKERMAFVDDGDFENFWQQHWDVHQRKGAPLYLPEHEFRQFFQQLRARQLLRLFEARTVSGRSIATQLVLLGPHPVTHTLSAAADKDEQQGGANAFLRWRVFEWLAAQGYRGNDLTDAHNVSVAHFKSQLGARLEMGLQVELPQSGFGTACDSVADFTRRACGKMGRLLQRGRKRS